MVTWTFDLLALVVGFVIGIIVGAFLFLFLETKDGGDWSKGFSEGFGLKCNLRDAKEIFLKIKEDGNDKGSNV